jgi:hypothetical protein
VVASDEIGVELLSRAASSGVNEARIRVRWRRLDLGQTLWPLEVWDMKPAIVMFSAIAMASLLAACGASSTGDTPTATAAPATTPVPTTVPTAVPTSAPTATPTPAPPAGGLTGVWSGMYTGVYTGTFTLTWQQTGTGVAGTIVLSSPAKTLSITGNEAGTSITFGAVGGVTYTGSVSGGSMIGTYTVPGTGSGGSWSATKSG